MRRETEYTYPLIEAQAPGGREELELVFNEDLEFLYIREAGTGTNLVTVADEGLDYFLEAVRDCKGLLKDKRKREAK